MLFASLPGGSIYILEVLYRQISKKSRKKSQDIVDRTGFEEFKRWALKDVTLPDKAEVISPVYRKGIKH